MSAIRLARGFTGRDLTIEIRRLLPGHVDSLLVKAGSGMATLGIADTQGVPRAFADTAIALPFNGTSVDALEPGLSRALRRPHRLGDRRAAGGGEHGLRAARSRLLAGVARHRHAPRFSADSGRVMTGFRLARGGAQLCFFGIRPDCGHARQSDWRRTPPSAHMAGAPISWAESLRPVRCIRRAHCPATSRGFGQIGHTGGASARIRKSMLPGIHVRRA